jgi:signal recognition particle receptor subunit beta
LENIESGASRLRAIDDLSYRPPPAVKDTDLALLVTDSTLENVLRTERIVSIVREDAPDVSFLCIANEQGLFQSLNVQRVEKILEVTTTSMIATEYFNRERRIRFTESISKSLGLDIRFLGHTGEWQAKEITLK